MTLLPRGGVVWLLLHELRLAYRSGAGVKPVWRIIGIVALGAFLLAFGAFAALGLRALSTLAAEGEQTQLVFAGITALTLGAFLLALLSGALAGVEALYRRQDLDLLFSSPLDPRAVLTVRAIGVAATAAAMLLAVATAAALWLAIWGAWRGVAILPFAVGLAALAGAAALSLTLALFRLVGPRATRTLAQIVAAVFGAAVFLGFQIPNLLPDAERAEWIADLPARIAALAPPVESPVWLPARAALGEPGPLALWLLATVTPFILVMRGFGHRFAHDAAAIAGMGRAAAAAPTRDPPFRDGFAAAIIAKEWRLLRRDPALLAQLLLQIVYLGPFLLIALTRAGASGVEDGVFLGTAAGIITLFAGGAAGLLTWLMISAELAPDLVAAAPVERRRIERLKAAAAIGPALVMAAAPALALALFAPGAAAFAMIWAAAASVANASIYTRHQRPMPRSALTTRSKAPFFVTVLSGVINTSFSAAAGVSASGLWPLAIIPALIAVGLTLAVLDLEPEQQKPVTARAPGLVARLRRFLPAVGRPPR